MKEKTVFLLSHEKIAKLYKNISKASRLQLINFFFIENHLKIYSTVRSSDGSVSFDGTTNKSINVLQRLVNCLEREQERHTSEPGTDMENNMLCLFFYIAFSSIASRLRFPGDASHCLRSACWKPEHQLSSVISCNYENYANSFLWPFDRISCETAERCVKLFITCLMRHNSVAMCN